MFNSWLTIFISQISKIKATLKGSSGSYKTTTKIHGKERNTGQGSQRSQTALCHSGEMCDGWNLENGVIFSLCSYKQVHYHRGQSEEAKDGRQDERKKKPPFPSPRETPEEMLTAGWSQGLSPKWHSAPSPQPFLSSLCNGSTKSIYTGNCFYVIVINVVTKQNANVIDKPSGRIYIMQKFNLKIRNSVKSSTLSPHSPERGQSPVQEEKRGGGEWYK